MKRIIISLIAFLFMTSCVTLRNSYAGTGVENLKKEDYTILPQDSIRCKSLRVYLLVLPIGGKKPWQLEKKAYAKLIQKTKADGLISEQYIHKKVWVPLILVSVVYRWVDLQAKPYVIKN